MMKGVALLRVVSKVFFLRPPNYFSNHRMTGVYRGFPSKISFPDGFF